MPEIVIVDNGSGDGSAESIAKACPHVRVIALQENRGFAAGMNVGIAETRGEYIFLLNSDICADNSAIHDLLDFMTANPDTALAAPLLFDDSGQTSRSLLIQPTVFRLFIPLLAKVRYNQWRKRLTDKPLDVEATEGAAIMVRRSALDRVGLMDERFFFYSEIVDWCMRFRKCGYSVQVLPTVRIKHIGSVSTAGIRRSSRIELKRSEYQLIHKHLGLAVCALAILRDVLAGSLKAGFYGLACAVSLGKLPRGREKLGVYCAILRWLAAGMPNRRDKRYIDMFGRWD